MSESFDPTRAPQGLWYFAVAAGAVTLVCGTLGGIQYEAGEISWCVKGHELLGAMYGASQMLILHTPDYVKPVNPLMEVGRWAGAAFVFAAAFLLFWGRARKEWRLFLLKGWNGHLIVCGLGEKGMAIIRTLKGRDCYAKIVVIDAHPDSKYVDECDRLGVPIIRKEESEESALVQARAAAAGEIIAVAVGDETNIRIAADVRKFRQNRGAAHAFCRVHIVSSYLPDALQKWTDSGADSNTSMRVFDVFDSEARRIFLNLPLEGGPPNTNFAPLDGSGISFQDPRAVHVVVLGMGRMGSSLLLRAAKMGIFANGKKLKVTVIDRNADRQFEQLFFRYPILQSATREVCELEKLPIQADSTAAREAFENFAAEPDTILHVFVCLDSDARTMEIGLRLWEIVKNHPDAYMNIRIKSEASLAPILHSSNARIQAFGMLDDTCTEETFRGERNERLAESIHEDFAMEQRKNPARANDPALFKWNMLRDDFRESNRQQADHMGIKMRAIGCKIVEISAPGQALREFTPAELEGLAELEHRRWCVDRWLSGWKYGTFDDPAKEKDPEKRLHKWLVDWNGQDAQGNPLLPDDIKERDRATVRKIPVWLARANPPLKVIRATGAQGGS